MRFRGVRENTWAWVVIVVAALVVLAALAWILFLAPQ
jgi:hypothetical protein